MYGLFGILPRVLLFQKPCYVLPAGRALRVFEPRLLPLVVHPPALHTTAMIAAIHRADDRAVERYVIKSPVRETEHALVMLLLPKSAVKHVHRLRVVVHITHLSREGSIKLLSIATQVFIGNVAHPLADLSHLGAPQHTCDGACIWMARREEKTICIDEALTYIGG